MPADIGIIIPVYNSPDHLPELLRRINTVRAALPQQFEILLVDDGSRPQLPDYSDQSGPAKICQQRHPDNRGKGRALKTGFAYFLAQEGIDGVITIDGDLQHPPELIPEFVDVFYDRKADLVIGSRSRDPKTMPLHRIASNALTSGIISTLIGNRVSDSQCGYRLYGRRALQCVNLSENRFHLESEFVIRAGWKKLAFSEIEVPTIYNGAPSAIRNMPDTWNFVELVFRLVWQRVRGNV